MNCFWVDVNRKNGKNKEVKIKTNNKSVGLCWVVNCIRKHNVGLCWICVDLKSGLEYNNLNWVEKKTSFPKKLI